MNESSLITILNTNQNYFQESEPVSLTVELKNISALKIKIFIISLEDFYLKFHKEIDSSINIDGLISHEEFYYEYKHPVMQKHREEFNFKSISD